MQRSYFCPMCHAARSGPKADCRECGWQARDIAAVRAAKRTAWDDVADGLELVQQGLRRQAVAIVGGAILAVIVFPFFTVSLADTRAVWLVFDGVIVAATVWVMVPFARGLWKGVRADVSGWTRVLAGLALVGTVGGMAFFPVAGVGGIAFLAYLAATGRHHRRWVLHGCVGALALLLAGAGVAIFTFVLGPYLVAPTANLAILSRIDAVNTHGHLLAVNPLYFEAGAFLAGLTLVLYLPLFYWLNAIAIVGIEESIGREAPRFARPIPAAPSTVAVDFIDADALPEPVEIPDGNVIEAYAAAGIDGWESVGDPSDWETPATDSDELPLPGA